MKLLRKRHWLLVGVLALALVLAGCAPAAAPAPAGAGDAGDAAATEAPAEEAACRRRGRCNAVEPLVSRCR